MTNGHDLNLTDRELRNRSFKGRNLKGANFSGSDLRGCNFSNAFLVGANFERVRTGVTLGRVMILATVGAIVAFLMALAVNRTVFSSLGEPLGGRKGSFIVALLVSLSLAGTGAAVKTVMATRFGSVVSTLSGTASGALLGFFYAGIATGEKPQAAIAGAVVFGVLMGIASLRNQTGAVAVAVASAAAVASYGLAFWLWAFALAFLTGQQLVWGILLSLLSLTYIGFTLSSLVLAFKEIRNSSGTSFRNADLTNASFANAQLKNTDFSGASGYTNKG
jgi:hypothetical protein